MIGIHLEIKVVCWIISEFRRAIKLEQTQYIILSYQKRQAEESLLSCYCVNPCLHILYDL